MPVRSGPTTKNSGSAMIGLMQVRIGVSATNITNIWSVLPAGSQIGALANTKYTGNVDWWDFESGYPAQIDGSFPIRESSMVEGAFMEQTPYNLALAHGLDPNAGAVSGEYSQLFSGEIRLGARAAPAYLRAEIIATYPDKVHHQYIIYPKAQIKSQVEMESQKEEGMSVPMTITSTPADSGVTGGDAVWDEMPLGRIYWD